MARFVETSGTLTNTTASLSAQERRGLMVGNPSDTTMYLRFGGTASATAGLPLSANDTLILTGLDAPSSTVSLFCAGTSKAYIIYEW